jgi:hypothetical protein
MSSPSAKRYLFKARTTPPTPPIRSTETQRVLTTVPETPPRPIPQQALRHSFLLPPTSPRCSELPVHVREQYYTQGMRFIVLPPTLLGEPTEESPSNIEVYFFNHSNCIVSGEHCSKGDCCVRPSRISAFSR